MRTESHQISSHKMMFSMGTDRASRDQFYLGLSTKLDPLLSWGLENRDRYRTNPKPKARLVTGQFRLLNFGLFLRNLWWLHAMERKLTWTQPSRWSGQGILQLQFLKTQLLRCLPDHCREIREDKYINHKPQWGMGWGRREQYSGYFKCPGFHLHPLLCARVYALKSVGQLSRDCTLPIRCSHLQKVILFNSKIVAPYRGGCSNPAWKRPFYGSL